MNGKMPDMSIYKTYLSGMDILLALSIATALYLLHYANELVILLFPIVPIIYGWKTKKIISSVLIGILPMTFLFLDLHMANLDNYTPERFNYVITYFAKLIAFGGIEGYLAVKVSKKYFVSLLVICFSVWFGLFMSGID